MLVPSFLPSFFKNRPPRSCWSGELGPVRRRSKEMSEAHEDAQRECEFARVRMSLYVANVCLFVVLAATRKKRRFLKIVACRTKLTFLCHKNENMLVWRALSSRLPPICV